VREQDEAKRREQELGSPLIPHSHISQLTSPPASRRRTGTRDVPLTLKLGSGRLSVGRGTDNDLFLNDKSRLEDPCRARDKS